MPLDAPKLVASAYEIVVARANKAAEFVECRDPRP